MVNPFQVLDEEYDMSNRRTSVSSILSDTQNPKTPSSTPVEGHLIKAPFEEDDFFEDENTVYPFKYTCTIGKCSITFKHPNTLLEHLKLEHRVSIFESKSVIVYLGKYLDEYLPKLEQIKPIDGVYVIGNTEEDRKLREKMQAQNLQEVLNFQEKERNYDAKEPKQCLFCNAMLSDRQMLFKHMFSDHHLNIGLVDNLVYVEEFLQYLRQKLDRLKCIFCSKSFKSKAQQRAHMRKKKHFRIDPKDPLFDKYYVINYLEKPSEEDAPSDNQSEGWEDWEDEPMKLRCLFCENTFPTIETLNAHLVNNYDFDLLSVLSERDFYSKIKTVNCIRCLVSNSACITCNEVFDSQCSLIHHMKENNHVTVSKWDDEKYLIPHDKNDALLTQLE